MKRPIQITEGAFCKGGLKDPPTTARPPDPHGQGGSRVPPRVCSGFDDGDIEELGDRIADLPMRDAIRLVEYLAHRIGAHA